LIVSDVSTAQPPKRLLVQIANMKKKKKFVSKAKAAGVSVIFSHDAF
jgi:hypothetical protein